MNKKHPTFLRFTSLGLSLALISSISAWATSETWTGGAGTQAWNSTSNWSNSTVPGVTTGNSQDTATFSSATSGTSVTIDSGRNVKYITFDLAAGPFTIGSAGANAGNTLSLTSGGAVTLGSTSTSFTGTATTETFNAPVTINGNYTFTNNSVDPTDLLNFEGNLSAGTSSAIELTLAGNNSGANTIGGVIANGSSSALEVQKSGNGTWVLSGANAYTGITQISAGILSISADDNLGADPGSATAGNIYISGAAGVLEATSSFTLASTRGIALGNVTATTGGTIAVAAGDTLTYNGIIANDSSGANVLEKTGPGTLALGGANTYSSSTFILGGTLELNFGASGAPTNNILSSSAALQFGNNASVGFPVAVSDTLSAVANSSTNNSQTINQTAFLVGGSHLNLTENGSGTLTVNLGTLLTRAQGETLDIGETGNVVVATSTANTTDGTIMMPEELITINGTNFTTISNGNIVPYNSVYSYTANTGTTLGAAYAVVDMTTASTTLAANTSALGDVRFNNAQATTINENGYAMTVGGGNTIAGEILETSNVGSNLDSITGGILAGMSGRDLVIEQNNTSGNFEIDSVITDYNGSATSSSIDAFTKAGAGEVILTAGNTYQGATYVNEGTLVVAGSYLAGSSQTLTTSSSSPTISGVNTTGLFVGERVAGYVLSSGTAGEYITAINTSAGTITLNADPAATGSGIVNFLGSGGLGTNSSGTGVEIAAGATLQLGNGTTMGSLEPGQGIVDNGSVILSGGSNSYTFSNVITGSSPLNGAGGLTKQGSGTATLAVLNSYSGPTTISGGILSVGSETTPTLFSATGSVAASTTITGVSSTAGLVIGQGISGTDIPAGAVITGLTSNTITMNVPGTGTASSTALAFTASTDLANGGQISAIGDSSNAAANLVLDGGTLQYTGVAQGTDRLFTVTTNGGALDASGSGALDFTNTGAIAYSGTSGTSYALTLTGTNTGANTLNPVLADGSRGATSLTKTGAGSWTVTAANTYSGGTAVNAGTLFVDNASGSSGTGVGTVAVANGGVLAGSGYIAPTVVAAGSFSFASGSALAPGTVGNTNALTLTAPSGSAAGYVAFNGAVTLDFNLNTSLASSSLALKNSFASEISGLSSSDTFNFTDLSSGHLATGEYTLISTDDTTSNPFGSITTATLSGATITGLSSYSGDAEQLQVNQVGGDYELQLNISAVPEPSTWGMMVAGLACCAFFALQQKWNGRPRGNLLG